MPSWIKKILFIKSIEDIGINFIKIKNIQKDFSTLKVLNDPSLFSLTKLGNYYNDQIKSLDKKKFFFEPTINKNKNGVSNDTSSKSSKAGISLTKRSSSLANQPVVQRQINANIENMLKITKLTAELYERNYVKTSLKQIISDEWKYVAARFDFFLFLFALLIVIGTPILLFARYLKEDFYSDLKCGCED